MQPGLFMMPLHPPETPLSQTYEEDRELLVLADELGYSETWIGEHATMAWENIPSPDQFIARAFPESATSSGFWRGVRTCPPRGGWKLMHAIKRQMYGRAKFDLLRKRVLLAR